VSGQTPTSAFTVVNREWKGLEPKVSDLKGDTQWGKREEADTSVTPSYPF